MQPKVSICIPAYKSEIHLRKALISCFSQDFRDFEIIITDDSPIGYLDSVIKEFSSDSRLKYYQNITPLGSPKNWNEAVKNSSGRYIKFLHHDDWFIEPSSLSKFVEMLDSNSEAQIAFSGSLNSDHKGNPFHIHSINDKQIKNLKSNPSCLIFGNFIGAPSAMIYRANFDIEFDSNLKWLVDIEFYIRILKFRNTFAYSKEALVGITTGSQDQVTAISHNNRMVEVFEHVYIFNKFKKLKIIDSFCYFQLWLICFKFLIFDEENMLKSGVPSDLIGSDIKILLRFLKWNSKVLDFLVLFNKLISPKFWINKTFRRIMFLVVSRFK